MVVFEVLINGTLVTTAGSADLCVLGVIVNAIGKLGPESQGTKDHVRGFEFHLDVGGLTARESEDDEHLNWARERGLNVGDEVVVRILESDFADEASEKKAARDTEERHERETFEWARKKYFEPRDKYEGTS